MIPSKMKKYIFSAIFMMCSLLMGSVILTSCDGEDELDTNQFSGGVSLNAYGPCPVARGGELQFIGNGLNNITNISIPGCADVTDIKRINSNKISIIVPKTAQPGYPVLHYKGGEIVPKTRLTFTEPVGFAAKNPFPLTPVKPGTVIEIKGSYLNLVQSIFFAEDVEVAGSLLEHSSADEPMEQWIKVKVPEEAQTGKIFLGFVATGDTLMNKVLSDTVFQVVLPSVKEKANLTGKKPGDKIEIAGADLDLVKKLSVNNTDIDFEISEAGDKISFFLPEETPDAAVFTMYPASKIPVEIAVIGMTIPTELSATPDKDLRDGSEVVIAGKDLDVVAKVTFPNDKVAEFSLEEGKIKVACPTGFVSGDLVLTCKSGIEVKIAIETQKPTFSSFGATTVSMGNDVVINGENLDLVSKVTYTGGLEGIVKEGGSATQITVTMPTSGVESGTITLNMANGESIETEELTIDAPVFCYLTSPSDLITSDSIEIQAGSLITTGCENGDHLTSVEVDGKATQFIINGKTLMILTTEEAGFDSKIKLISDNGEIEYDLSVIPNTSKKVVLWSGMTEITWKDGGRVFVPASALETVPEDAVLHFCFTQKDQTWGQAQINNGWWATLSGLTTPEGGEINNPIVPTDIYGWFSDGILNRDLEITLTKELRDHLLSHVGEDGSAIVIQGENIIFTQVYATWEISLETDIANFSTFEPGNALTYPFTFSWNDAATGKVRILRDGLSKMKVGSSLFIYKEGTGQCQINDAKWSAITTAADWVGDVNPIVVTIDETMMKCITGEITDGWSNTAFILQGDGLKVTKITILP